MSGLRGNSTVSKPRTSTSGRKQDYNRLGIVYAQFQRYNQAETAFNKVISLDPDFTGARINLGNLQFLQGNINVVQEQQPIIK